MACRLVDDRGDGRELDLVAMTPPRFLVRREEDFHRLPAGLGPLRALLRLLSLAITRRSTFTALLTLARLKAPWPIGRPPRYLDSERYHGIHTFWLEKNGHYRGVRYHWRPVDPLRLKPDRPDRLDHALTAALGRDSNVTFDLIVDMLDEDPPYRKTNDPLRRWPAWPRELPCLRTRSRLMGTTRYTAGRLTLTTLEDHAHPAHEQWVFNPVPAIDGFEASDDEILEARGSTYLASHVRRRSHQ